MYIITAIILTVTLAGFAFAKDNPDSDTTKTYNLDPITITATRTAAARSVVAPSISVIPQEILTTNPQKSILSLVSQQVPGVFQYGVSVEIRIRRY